MISYKKKLINNLSSIKKILGEREKLITRFYETKYITAALLSTGSATIIYCALLFTLRLTYKKFSLFPTILKIVFVFIPVLLIVILVLIKINYLKKKEKNIKGDSENKYIENISIKEILTAVLPLLLVSGLYWFVFIEFNLYRLIMGMIIINIGIICINLSNVYKIIDLFYFAIYLCVWGIISLFFLYNYPLITVSSSFGVGWIFWAIFLIYYDKKSRKKQKSRLK